MKKTISFLLVISSFFVNTPPSSMDMDDNLADRIYAKASAHILKINIDCRFSAYSHPMRSTGTGFWLGGDSRFIVTNAHIASPKKFSKYTAEDFYGNIFDLELVYTNPLMDLAYMRPISKEITQPNTNYTLDEKAELNSRVFMIGNNGGNGIVVQDGRISDCHEIKHISYPTEAITVSINGKGGSSGSPVINHLGHIIGVNYGGSDVATYVVPARYLNEDLGYLLRGITPPKKDIGLIFEHISINEAIKFGLLPNIDNTEYNAQFHNAKSRLLYVISILTGSPAEGILLPGDIITSINGIPLGASLYPYCHALNESNDSIELTCFRHCKEVKVKIPTYDLNKLVCQKMLIAGNTVFSEADHTVALHFNVRLGAVGVYSSTVGSIFSEVLNIMDDGCCAFVLYSINQKEIKSLEDIIDFFKSQKQEIHFSFTGANYNGVQRPFHYRASYNPEENHDPLLLTFSIQKGKWNQQKFR